MNDSYDRVVMLCLAALYSTTEQVGPDPMEPHLDVRALLAGLLSISSGDRRAYDDYWNQALAQREHEYDGAARYTRATYMRTHWSGIVRTLGLNPQSMEFHFAITGLIANQRERIDPEFRARRVSDRLLREAGASREIIATKGHPRSAYARQVMAERIARGEELA